MIMEIRPLKLGAHAKSNLQCFPYQLVPYFEVSGTHSEQETEWGEGGRESKIQVIAPPDTFAHFVIDISFISIPAASLRKQRYL